MFAAVHEFLQRIASELAAQNRRVARIFFGQSTVTLSFAGFALR